MMAATLSKRGRCWKVAHDLVDNGHDALCQGLIAARPRHDQPGQETARRIASGWTARLEPEPMGMLHGRQTLVPFPEQLKGQSPPGNEVQSPVWGSDRVG